MLPGSKAPAGIVVEVAVPGRFVTKPAPVHGLYPIFTKTWFVSTLLEKEFQFRVNGFVESTAWTVAKLAICGVLGWGTLRSTVTTGSEAPVVVNL